eukprot:TRINITY_DN18617_c0_g1_i1.p1 TRINITY_DN18617_c0_g1~~TRINITY_DN18617_c0_g1_i1.p1  ORF type:complete len:355 (+),score=27.94 TRINITY_DN18617_c0_g1_i1:139-1065(+)
MVSSPSVLAVIIHVTAQSFVHSVLMGVEMDQFTSFIKSGIRPVGHGIMELSMRTFRDHVLDDTEAHWVVLFCTTGDTTCDEVLPSYERACLRQVDLANDRAPGQVRRVRLGKVDCARDVGLCGQRGVNAFPTVAYYVQGIHRGNWTSGGRQGLVPWLVRSFAGDNFRVGCDGAWFGQKKGQSRFIVNCPIGGRAHSGEAFERRGQGETQDSPGERLSLVAPICKANHLKRLHDSILMKDSIFARSISFLLVLAIFVKCSWIVLVDGVDIVSTLRRFWQGNGLTSQSDTRRPVDRAQRSQLAGRMVVQI